MYKDIILSEEGTVSEEATRLKRINPNYFFGSLEKGLVPRKMLSQKHTIEPHLVLTNCYSRAKHASREGQENYLPLSNRMCHVPGWILMSSVEISSLYLVCKRKE